MGRPVPNKARGNCEGIAVRPGRFAVLLRRFGFDREIKRGTDPADAAGNGFTSLLRITWAAVQGSKFGDCHLARVDVVIGTPDLGFQNQRFTRGKQVFPVKSRVHKRRAETSSF